MSAATLTVTVTNTDTSQSLIHVYGTIAVQASPATYTTGGNTLSFAGFSQIPSSQVPLWVDIQSAQPAGSANTHSYVYQFLPGTTMANGTMQIYTGAAAQTALTELSSGSIPAGVSGDTIVFRADFQRL